MNRWVIAFVARRVIVLRPSSDGFRRPGSRKLRRAQPRTKSGTSKMSASSLLSRVQKVANTKYKLAMISLAELVSCERQCLDGRLDAARAPSQRIAVLEEF